MPNDLVTVLVDGHSVSVPKGTNAVDAAHTLGIEVPIFCHHPRLVPVGMCRMCLVEVGTPAVDRATGAVEMDAAGQPVIRFLPKLQTACTTVVSEGMVVRTATPVVADARKSVLELLLTSHPLDCPVCDKGGECPLQNLTMRYGPGLSRFAWGEKFHFPKPVPIGPLIALDRERCVLCARCIRFEDEVADDHVLGFENRGRGMEIVSFSDPPFQSYFSGNTSDICPVGALTTKDFRFEARAWEVVGQPGVCDHCPVGCNLMFDTRHGHTERVMPRENNAVNEIWLCDKGRFAHHHAASPDRLRTPLVRRDGELMPASWEEALGIVAERLRGTVTAHGPAAVGGVAGDGVPNEDLYLFGRLIRGILGSPNVDHRPGVVRDDVLLSAGAGSGTELTRLGHGDTVLVVGLDVEEEAPVLFLNLLKAARNGAKLVVLAGRPQKLDRQANVLRWRYGAEDAVLAALANATLGLLGEGATADAPPLASGVSDYTAEALAGLVPVGPEQLAAAADALATAENVLLIYGSEAVALGLVPGLAALARAAGHAGRDGNGLLAVGPHANSQGAADMGLLPGWLPGYQSVTNADAVATMGEIWPSAPPADVGLDAAAMFAGGVRALFILGTDPAADDPATAEALAKLDFLVVQELFRTATAELADVVLPAQSAAERAGTFTNFARRVQRFDPAVDPVGESRAGWHILRGVAVRLGVAEPYDSAADVFDELARVVPQYAGLSYAMLGSTQRPEPMSIMLPFAPITEARKVSYEGTGYGNDFGVGQTWPLGESLRPAPTWQPRDSRPAEGLTLVPVARLYDHGTLATASLILHPLVPAPHVLMSPFDATPLGLVDGMTVRVAGGGQSIEAELRVQDGLTPGVLLAPLSLAWATPPTVLLQGRPYAPVTVTAVEA